MMTHEIWLKLELRGGRVNKPFSGQNPVETWPHFQVVINKKIKINTKKTNIKV